MADRVQPGTSSLLPAAELARTLALQSAPNGIRYTSFGETKVADAELERIVQAVPAAIAPALASRAFYFVPLAIPEQNPRAADHTLVSPVFTQELSDEAICHRNVEVAATANLPGHEGIFISARLLRDQFALAFEFFINVGHLFADAAWFGEGNILDSGWAWGQTYLNDAVAVAQANVGKGKVLLFGPEITFRGQPHATFKFLFNGVLYGAATPTTLK